MASIVVIGVGACHTNGGSDGLWQLLSCKIKINNNNNKARITGMVIVGVADMASIVVIGIVAVGVN